MKDLQQEIKNALDEFESLLIDSDKSSKDFQVVQSSEKLRGLVKQQLDNLAQPPAITIEKIEASPQRNIEVLHSRIINAEISLLTAKKALGVIDSPEVNKELNDDIEYYQKSVTKYVKELTKCLDNQHPLRVDCDKLIDTISKELK